MIDEQFRRTLNIEYKKFNNIQANSTNKITEHCHLNILTLTD